jgi:hypothetical protein
MMVMVSAWVKVVRAWFRARVEDRVRVSCEG